MTLLLTATMMLLFLLFAGCKGGEGARSGDQRAGDVGESSGSQKAKPEKSTVSLDPGQSIVNVEVDDDLEGELVFQLSGPYDTSSYLEISSMNANGSDLKQLTDMLSRRHMGDSSEDPAWSPDLEKIAFTRLVEEYLASASASGAASASAGSAAPTSIRVPYVSVMDADGSDEMRLVDRAAVQPDWLPDGKLVAFSSHETWSSRGASEYVCDLYVASVDDPGSIRRLTDDPSCESNPSWSPDGKEIAFTTNWSGNLDIYVIDACCEAGATNLPQRLTDDLLDDTDPSWSPDGKKIAFTRQDFPGASPGLGSINATSGIFVMDSDGTDLALAKIFEMQAASFLSPQALRPTQVSSHWHQGCRQTVHRGTNPSAYQTLLRRATGIRLHGPPRASRDRTDGACRPYAS
jgi:Tol biopolymer transport system component